MTIVDRQNGHIYEGDYSQEPARVRLIVRDSAALQAIIERNSVPNKAPKVDFTRQMIVFAAQGMRTYTGDMVIVEAVRDIGDSLVIVVLNVEPARGCSVGQGVTHPIDIARVPLSHKPVRFEEHYFYDPRCAATGRPKQDIAALRKPPKVRR